MANIIVKLSGPAPKSIIASSLKYAGSHYLPSFLKYLGEVLGASKSSALVQVLNDDAVAANATITVGFANMTDGDTVRIGAMTLTAKSSGASGPQFNIGASDAATAVNLATAISSNSSGLLFGTPAAAVVTVKAGLSGPLGNAIPIIISQTTPGGMTASASALSSGADDSASPIAYQSF